MFSNSGSAAFNFKNIEKTTYKSNIRELAK